jgi:alanyl-tRNA synthetase
MKQRSGSAIREDFLRFFEGKRAAAQQPGDQSAQGHRRVHSSSLVPANDPTLLFTNAGMNQFKDVFLGAEKRDYTRATSSQKCVRAGGKHNDLENVGFTRRHHTFFEMLGNFSFGDYFKREAIAYAWEFLTSPEWCGIDSTRLYVTIWDGTGVAGLDQGPDEDAKKLWIETGVPAERIFGMPGKDNFWQMGETGPCGPCSEIFYDFGVAASEHTDANGIPQEIPFPADAQRYVEIWNLVFMQFDRSVATAAGKDGTAATYAFTPLPKPSIDTGMGLERIACVLQGVTSNFETDLFTPLIDAAAVLVNFNPTRPTIGVVNSPLPTDEQWLKSVSIQRLQNASLRIISDHARAATFLISDGVVPSNEGRGYVLRKILRRGIRHGRLLGQSTPFMFEMVDFVVSEMRVAYPELSETATRVAKTVFAEEQQFARALELGSRHLDQEIAKAQAALIGDQMTSGRAGVIRQAYTEDYLGDSYDKEFDALDYSSPTDMRLLYKTYRIHFDPS